MESVCEKCGEPIAFKRLDSGKWCPTNVDGSDHWDICKRISLKKAGKQLLVHEFQYITAPLGDMPMIFSDLPPWDESIQEDWSWCKGHQSVEVEVQREYRDPCGSR